MDTARMLKIDAALQPYLENAGKQMGASKDLCISKLASAKEQHEALWRHFSSTPHLKEVVYVIVFAFVSLFLLTRHIALRRQHTTKQSRPSTPTTPTLEKATSSRSFKPP